MDTNTKLRKRVSFSHNLPNEPGPSSSASANLTISPVDEQFISQIVLTPTSIEQPLANVLSSVFAAGRAEQFISTLQTWSGRKEQEIETVCAEGYGLFVPSVDAVLGRVRENAAVLEQRVETLRNELSSSAQQIYDTRIERFEARKMLLNVGKAIRALDDCLRALNLLQRINLDINDGAYQDAVKLIDELQGKGLLRAIEEMPFCKQIESALEMSKKRVWDASSSKVKSWLGKVREDSVLMGSLALSQLQTRFEQFERFQQEQGQPNHDFQLFLAEHAAEDVEIITSNDLFKVDFTPLQNVWRLFSMMDRQHELIDLLIDTRKVQLELVLGCRVSLERADSDPRSFRSFLNGLVGFFIFDRLLSRLPLGIYPFSQVELRWEQAQGRIREIALESLKLSASDRAAFMKIKWQLVFFTHCADMFGFPVSPLVETILTLFYRYIDLLRQETIERCQLSILKDTFTQNCPETKEMSRLLPNIEATDGFAPFTPSVWESILATQAFLANFKVFLEGVPGVEGRRADFADLSRRTVDSHILGAVARTLQERIHDESLTAPGQRMRILVNLNWLKQLCQDDGGLVRLVCGLERCPGISLANAKTAFQSAFNVCQNALQAGAVNDINGMLERLNYDPKPLSKANNASPVIQEIIRYLRDIKGDSTTILKENEPLWCSILASISSFVDGRILADVSFPHCNATFFQNLSLDLNTLKDFCQELSPDPGPFVEQIAQPLELCSLMAAESVHEFLDPVVRQRKYSHIETDRLVSVLGKIKEPAEKLQSIEDLILLLK